MSENKLIVHMSLQLHLQERLKVYESDLTG
jgi:hypothetical protein